MDVSILEDLGLTQSEIKVYLTLLELGSTTAGAILDKSGLQNSVVHRALNSLIEKGIISFILEGRRRVYQAPDPGSFNEFIEDKKRRFQEILPELRQKQIQTKNEEATLYKGKRGIKEIYIRLLNSGGEEYLTFGGGKRVCYEIMGEAWWKNIHTRRISKKIPSRQVFDETIRKFGDELNKRPISQVRFLSQKFEQLTETVIIGEYVAISIFTDNPYGLLIRDKAAADGYRKYFELLWKKAKL